MEFLLALVGGLTLGSIHAFDADHIAAVSAFASRHPHPGKAAWFGVVWGLGHTVTVLLFGGLSVALKFVIPPIVESIAEVAVGVFLIGIGIWVLRDILKRRHIHVHKHIHDGVEHFHFHSHENAEDHRHRHSMFLVGATHGLAGSASIMVIVPITLSQSLFTAVLYLLLFGVGTIVSMGTFAYLIGTVSKYAGGRNLLPYIRGIAAAASLVVGILWVGEAMAR